ncbi:integrase core domain-containing protein [Flavobacterium limi]|nr:integrase core domain-containing protein [Flavobacterium limi]
MYCNRTRNDLMAEGCIEALEMALKNRMYHEPIIHHSDRGSQYCSHQYVNLLHQNAIRISMSKNGDPYKNALAERVNGIIKTEFNLHSSQLGFEQTYNQIKKSIKVYNEIRPHSSCDYLIPNQAHLQSGNLKKRWNYNKKFSHEKTAV